MMGLARSCAYGAVGQAAYLGRVAEVVRNLGAC